MSRRDFLTTASVAAAAIAFPYVSRSQPPATATAQGDGAPRPGGPPHRCIDIHAHQGPDNRRGLAQAAAKKRKSETAVASAARTEAQFMAHQKAINALGSVILGGNDYEYEFIKANPQRYVRFASAGQGASDDSARAAIVEHALENGAKGIGEHRWEGDTPFTQRILDLARDYKVPILFHFQEAQFPKAVYKEFYKTIEKYPTVTFIGHAIDWWGSIDKNYNFKAGTYPRGRVTPGGLTDIWLTRYPNLHCDLSATSGNTGLLRDPDFAKDFVNRHQDKIMYGTDCPCTTGNTPTCWAVIKHVAIAQLQLSPAVLDKIYFGNAQKMLGIKID